MAKKTAGAFKTGASKTGVSKTSLRKPQSAGGVSAPSRYDLYELTVQSPAALVPFLQAIHGRTPRVLGEDFCGSASLSRYWAGHVAKGKAVAIDIDEEPLARAEAALAGAPAKGAVTLIRHNLLKPLRAKSEACDVIFVGNFSIGEIHSRADLVEYFKRCRGRLKAGGVFVCDTYGGSSAFHTGAIERIHHVPPEHAATFGGKHARIRYTWQQQEADPLTGRVVNALHYRVQVGGEITHEVAEAFVYRWRLWSVPELREAMSEAGFKGTDVYAKLVDAVDHEGRAYVHPVRDAGELEDNFIVCVAGRK